jgi:hypothetical protein
MPSLHRWRNFKLALLRSRSDGDGLCSVYASRKSAALGKGLLTNLKRRYSVMAIHSVQATTAAALVADNTEVKSP